MFRQFDRDGNGFITLMEASNILQKDPFKFPPSKVLTLLKQFDKDGNGKLDIEEFAGFYAEAKAMSVTVQVVILARIVMYSVGGQKPHTKLMATVLSNLNRFFKILLLVDSLINLQ